MPCRHIIVHIQSNQKIIVHIQSNQKSGPSIHHWSAGMGGFATHRAALCKGKASSRHPLHRLQEHCIDEHLSMNEKKRLEPEEWWLPNSVLVM